MTTLRQVPDPTDPASDAEALVPVQRAIDEEWRPVVGYEGQYEVSSLGRVRSVNRISRYLRRTGRVVERRLRGRVLKMTASPNGGHIQTHLGNSCGPRWVHHLVLEAFVGPRPPELEALHGNGNPADNRPGNLRWGTSSENTLDTIRHGTHNNASRVACRRGGHLLVAPNLLPSRFPFRECKACSRAWLYARRHGLNEEARNAYADVAYLKIMKGLR